MTLASLCLSEIREPDEKQSSEDVDCFQEQTSEERPEPDQKKSDRDMEAFVEVKKPPMSRNIGKSGKKYTAEELEMLIKE